MATLNNKKGFWLFYDWIDDLEYLDGDDAWKIVKAICEYYRNGINPIDNVDEKLKVIASIIFRQIKRGEEISEQRQEAGQSSAFARARSNKSRKTTKNNVSVEQPLNKKQKSNANDTFVEHPLNKKQKSNANDTFVEQPLNKKQKSNANDTFVEHPLNKKQKSNANDTFVEHPLNTRSTTNYLLHNTNYNNSFSLSNTESQQLKLVKGTLGKGKLFLSDDQLNDLCSKLSLDELEHYANAIVKSEEKGHHFGKTHYEAILEMANQDRWLEKNQDRWSEENTKND